MNLLYTFSTFNLSRHDKRLCYIILCACAQPAQVEVVLLVLRRLVEDLHGPCHSLTSVRRREMSAALREQIGAVYQFLMQNIEVQYVCTYYSYNRA